MVRKWSYIKDVFTLDESLNSYYKIPSKQKHVFRVFRSNTRFKRWSVGLTSFVRKKYTRRKHLYNYAVFAQVTNYWVRFYLNSRNSVLFYQNLNLFNGYFGTISSNLLKKYLVSNSDLIKGFGFNLINTTAKVNFFNRLPIIYGFKNLNPYLVTTFTQNSLSSGLFIKTVDSSTKPTKLDIYLTSFSDNKLSTSTNFFKNEVFIKSSISQDLKTTNCVYQTLVIVYQINIYLVLLTTKLRV